MDLVCSYGYELEGNPTRQMVVGCSEGSRVGLDTGESESGAWQKLLECQRFKYLAGHYVMCALEPDVEPDVVLADMVRRKPCRACPHTPVFLRTPSNV